LNGSAQKEERVFISLSNRADNYTRKILIIACAAVALAAVSAGPAWAPIYFNGHAVKGKTKNAYEPPDPCLKTPHAASCRRPTPGRPAASTGGVGKVH